VNYTYQIDQLPEKVCFAKDVTVPNEAFVLEGLVAVRALQALGVPVLVQDAENEPIQDHHSTSSAFWDRR